LRFNADGASRGWNRPDAALKHGHAEDPLLRCRAPERRLEQRLQLLLAHLCGTSVGDPNARRLLYDRLGEA
jgi:hypothetical protein